MPRYISKCKVRTLVSAYHGEFARTTLTRGHFCDYTILFKLYNDCKVRYNWTPRSIVEENTRKKVIVKTADVII